MYKWSLIAERYPLSYSTLGIRKVLGTWRLWERDLYENRGKRGLRENVVFPRTVYGCSSNVITLHLHPAKTSISSSPVLMAPNPLIPSIHLKDAPLFINDIFTLPLRTDMSVLNDNTAPSSWSGTEGKHGCPHPCICFEDFLTFGFVFTFDS